MLPYAVLACRVLLGGVLICAAVQKLRRRPAFAAFVAAVRRLGGVPARLAVPAAAAVVAAEFVIGGVLLLGAAPVAAFAAAFGLLAPFTAVLARAARRRLDVACACFGRDGDPVAGRHVARNAVLLAAAAIGVAGSAAGGGAVPEPAGAALCVAAALVAVLIIILIDDLAVLLRGPAGPRT